MTAPALPGNPWFSPHPKLGIGLMDHLFNRMDGAYPNIWRANFKNPDSIANWKEAWAEAFEEEGIKPADLQAAIKACVRKFERPPSLPQFLSLCRPDIGVEAEVLFYRAVTEMTKRRSHQSCNWPSAPLFWAAAAMGNDLLTTEYRYQAGRWKAMLDSYANKHDPIPDIEPAAALPAPRMSKEDAAARLSAMGGKVKAIPRGNQLRMDWAEYISEHHKTMSFAAKRIAAEAFRNVGRPVPTNIAEFLPAGFESANDACEMLKDAA
ncbi:replication protein P [Chromobacterium haemolyticum]|uniref:replication protein P n=1 Tax=Chromobacterium TaxID=535 RepID=UPI0040572229